VMGGSGRVLSDRAVSIADGLKNRGVKLQSSSSDSVDDALTAAKGADVVVACGGATTTEAKDRDSLSLDNEGFLVSLGERLQKSGGAPLVIAAIAPAQIVTPWAANAAAAAVMFLGGQEMGNAWAQVLTGEINPSGKLPVTFPATQSQMLGPCPTDTCVYDEQLLVGWRALQDQTVSFAFGHGLSYTSFGWAWVSQPAVVAPQNATEKEQAAMGSLDARAVRLKVAVTNTGARAGRETVQVYVRYPTGAGEPTLMLRAYAKTHLLQQNESTTVELTLSARDVSMWHTGEAGCAGSCVAGCAAAATFPNHECSAECAAACASRCVDECEAGGWRGEGAWRRVQGEFTFMVGPSSRDHRLQSSLQLPGW
jgi:beta-glucosidase